MYAKAGASSYWVVDPDGEEITVMANESNQFVVRARLGNCGVHQMTEPFPVTVDLAALFG